MKKKIVLALMAITLSAALMTGCGSSSSTEENASADATATETADTTEETDTSADTESWTDSDQQGVLDATGFEMTAPDGATDIYYSYTEDGKIADMTYNLDGAVWSYRMEYTDELTEISGLDVEWTSEENGTLSGMEAIYYSYTDDDNVTTNQLVNWYDAVTGISYSLSAYAEDTNGMDIQVYAENIYQSMQGESTDDAEADAANELQTYFIGQHTSSNDGSELDITDNGDGTYKVDIDIFRLCTLENGVGTFADHKMTFEVNDPNENPMKGEIYLDSDNSLCIKITDSTWNYLPNDEVIEGFDQ